MSTLSEYEPQQEVDDDGPNYFFLAYLITVVAIIIGAYALCYWAFAGEDTPARNLAAECRDQGGEVLLDPANNYGGCIIP